VHAGRVEVGEETVGTIEQGLVAFVGAGKHDADKDAAYVANKVAGLRVFEDERGKMSRSVLDVGGAVLAVSQFTVYGDMRRGRRPSFDDAMEPGRAQELFEIFVQRLRDQGVNVQTGRFRAMMRVVVDNDGPVTILIDSHKAF
jgi:D-tyrosyl-tRNA(Tyr) deacylase